ncbi:hypothetical protein CSB07_01280 [Candidatus Gracilibacteria bacterium]|nr:MAG: hypothetical protein CSB07_01280 [Candidatus Gracilibacteria bacterium]PIE85088.1 MAG: hypothetical protein CSA08_04055 [Candidatus Gracilibacteria bacterium]
MLSTLYGINEKTLSYYFINVISDFALEKEKEESDEKLFMGKRNTCRPQYISKYSKLKKEGYFNSSKLGKNLCVDEKNINGKVYTIFSNPDLKQGLVGIIPGVKSKNVTELVRKKSKFKDRLIVKEVALDMARNMEWIARELFPQARQVVDRFHVMKNVLGDIQAVRIRLKTGIIKEELDLETKSKIERIKYSPKEYKLNNNLSETKKELITRVRYQLFKRKKDWNDNQKDRWKIIKKLKNLEELVFSYEVVSDLFDIFDEKKGALSFQQWFSKISKRENIIEMQNSGRIVQNHLVRILAYFDNKFTNAFAESLNSRIKRFISNLRGFKNQDYMIYRIIRKFDGNF